MTHPQVRYPIAFGATAALVYAVAFFLARTLAGDDAGALATGITLDLTLVVPLLYYLFVVRGAGARPLTVVPVFLLSLGVAHLIVPSAHRGALDVISQLAIPLEIALLGYVIVTTTRAIRRARSFGEREPDLLARCRQLGTAVLPSRLLGDVLAHELAAIAYGLFSWRTAEPTGPDAFSYHRQTGYGSFLVGVLVIATLEMGIVHVLLMRWQPAVAWTLLAISLYTVLWVIGDYRAMRLRPVVVGTDAIEVRLGLRWDARVPLRAIARVRRPLTDGSEPRPDLRAVALWDPNLVLELTEPVTAHGLFGMRRQVSTIALALDEREQFEALLAEARGLDGEQVGSTD